MRVDELERELRAERIEPNSEFARELDEWAAAGFPRRGEPGAFERLRARLTVVPPRRTLLRVGAVATAVVFTAVGLSKVDLSGSSGEDSGSSLVVSEDRGASGGGESSLDSAPNVAPSAGAADEYELAPQVADGQLSGLGEDPASASAAERSLRVAKRKIAQKVDLSLATSPGDFRAAADGVFDVIATYDGFVLESSISGGDPRVKGAAPGQASFKLKIPAGELQPALAELSDLGHVVARTDGTEDITGRFIGAKRRIADFTEARQNLLAQLEDAVTEAEQQSIRARLGIVESQLRDAQGDLGSAKERVHMVPVSVAISSDETIVKDGDSDEGSGWSIGDALDDAGDVLTVMAGIALVSLAVMVPLALVGLVLWWIGLRIQRLRRERALDAA